MLSIRPGHAAQRQLLARSRFQQDVANLDPAQLAEDDRGRHRPSLGRRVGTGRVRFADLGHQPGLLGQVIERLPQRIGEHADEYVGFGAAAVAVSYTHLTLPTIYSV